LYGGASAGPALPRAAFDALPIVERSRHGYAAIFVAAKPFEPND
jgi:hypothetical protein